MSTPLTILLKGSSKVGIGERETVVEETRAQRLPYPANLAGHVVVEVAGRICPLAIWLSITESMNYPCRINALGKIMNAQN
jgi:hypothetical protein